MAFCRAASRSPVITLCPSTRITSAAAAPAAAIHNRLNSKYRHKRIRRLLSPLFGDHMVMGGTGGAGAHHCFARGSMAYGGPIMMGKNTIKPGPQGQRQTGFIITAIGQTLGIDAGILQHKGMHLGADIVIASYIIIHPAARGHLYAFNLLGQGTKGIDL